MTPKNFDEDELRLIQTKLIDDYHTVDRDLQTFNQYIKKLANTTK